MTTLNTTRSQRVLTSSIDTPKNRYIQNSTEIDHDG